jgi:hypothetical protein
MAGAVAARRRKRRRRRLPRAAIAIGLVVAAALWINISLAVRPAVLEARIREALSRVLETPFRYGSFGWSWTRGAEVRDVEILDPGGGGTLLSARAIRVRPGYPALLRGRFEVERVTVEGPDVRLFRGRDGKWNAGGIFKAGFPPASGTVPARRAAFPGILIEDGRFACVEEGAPGRSAWTVEGVFAEARSLRDGSVAFRAEMRLDVARRVEVAGTAELAEGGPVVRFGVEARKVDIAWPLARLLGGVENDVLRSIKAKGFVDVVGDFKYDANEGLVPIGVTASVLRAELATDLLPASVRGLKGTLHLRERSIEARDIEGLLGDGRLNAEGRVELAHPIFARPPSPGPARWTLKCSLDSFVIDERLRDALPRDAPARLLFDHYRPRGRAGADVRILDARGFPPRAEDVSATVRLDGCDLVYHEFPYPVSDVRGELLVEKGRIAFERPLTGRSGPVLVTASGKGLEIARGGDVDLTIRVEGLPLDEKLRSALPAAVLPIWDDLRLVGAANGIVSIVRKGAAPAARADPAFRPQRAAVDIFAYPRDVRLSYRGFPYEVRGISGKVQIELEGRSKRVTLDDLVGRHGGQVIAGSGVVELDGPSRMEINLRSESIAADADLAAALSPGARRLLSDFNFKGRARVGVRIHSTAPGASGVEADVDLIEGSVEHKRFPYPLQLAGGRLRAVGDHTIEFDGLSTPRGAAPGVIAGGTLTTRGSERTLGFNLDIADLKFDAGLVRALPAELAGFVTRMKLGGVYRGRLKGVYIFDEDDPAKDSIDYAGIDVSAREAAVDFGLKIHDMVARGSFAGAKGSGRPHRLVGEVEVESAWFNRLHLTNGDIDFVLGVSHPAILEAREGRTIEGRGYLPPRAIIDRLSKDVDGTFQMLFHSKDLYGGVVDGFLYVDTGSRADIGGDFVGKDLQVARAQEDIFGTRAGGTAGTAKGHISFEGKNGEPASITGRGEGTIEKARLVELPLFLGILSALFGEESSRHYFHEVLLRYKIAGGKFVAASDGIEIRSAAVKLLGGGTLDFRGELDLTLQPRLLDFKIPVVEQILLLLKKGLAQVWVTGNLTQPKVQFVTGAGILRIGIDPASPDAGIPLPTDLRGGKGEKKGAPQGKER